MREVESVSSRRENKWVFSVLIDGTEDDALEMLEDLGEHAMEMNATASAAITLISDIEEWENCRCGRKRDEATMTRLR